MRDPRTTLNAQTMMYSCRESSMPAKILAPNLTQLEACRYRFEPGEAARVVQLLNRLDALRLPDPTSLIRFHETLLFLRAFPQGPSVVRAAERILNGRSEEHTS